MITKSESEVTFLSVYNSSYAPDDAKLKEANLLLLPYHNYREGIEYCFTEYAMDFLTYLKAQASDAINADIAITDEKYCALEMHSLILDIGIFIATNVILSSAVNLLSNYIYDKIKSMHEKKENVNIRVQIIAQNEKGCSKSITYDGPASEFEIIKSTAEELLKE